MPKPKRRPPKAEEPKRVQYFAAKLQGTWPDPVSCFVEHGFSKEAAAALVRNASINQSKVIFSRIDRYKTLIVTLKDGCQGWWAINGELFDSPDEARELAEEVEQELQAGGEPPGTWAVFEQSSSHHWLT